MCWLLEIFVTEEPNILEEKELNHFHLRSSGMITTDTFSLDFLVFFLVIVDPKR